MTNPISTKAQTLRSLTARMAHEAAARPPGHEGTDSVVRKMSGDAFTQLWNRYAADPIGQADDLAAWLDMVRAYAVVLHQRAEAASAAQA